MRRPTPLDPLATIPSDPAITALPKADLHIHQEWSPRLDRVLARRAGHASYDWHPWAESLMRETPPGMPRLARLSRVFPAPPEADADPANVIARLEDLLEEAAADGAVYAEPRFGGATALEHPDFMTLFREAERRVRERHPALRAEAAYTLLLWDEPERLERIVTACLQTARDGLAGIDLLYRPYDAEAEWGAAAQIAARAAGAGLGVTAHAGEFSAANIAAAARLPGLTRLGHAVYAAGDPRLLELLAARGITVECCLTCNVVLGAVPAYEAHPIRRFLAHGIPVALCTDNPVQLDATIGHEYAAASALGLSPTELLGITTAAVRASFAPPERKRALLAELHAYASTQAVR
jgi:adenosine deaminase